MLQKRDGYHSILIYLLSKPIGGMQSRLVNLIFEIFIILRKM